MAINARDRIIQSTAELLKQKDISKITVEEIAADADVSIPRNAHFF